MAVQLDCAFESVNATQPIEGLKCGSDVLLVWWYCGLKKNRVDQSQPLALVAFRKKIAHNTFSDEIVYRDIPVILLGQLRIGSLCQNNRVIALADFKTKRFNLKFQKGHWWFTSFYDASDANRMAPYPLQIYPLLYAKDKNFLVEFRLEGGGTLLIPSLEYFTRCYGQSGELRRILMTYPWDSPGGCNERLLFPLNDSEESGLWKIRLNKRLTKGDGIFVAHVKYDDYTRRVAKSIYSHLEKEYSGDSNKIIFPRIGPWYVGDAQLMVKGIPFNYGNSFLGLQVCGVSMPDGVEINVCRDSRNNAKTPADDQEDGNAWTGTPGKQINHVNENICITGLEAPDHGSSVFEINDPEMIILGKPRKVTFHRDEQAKGSRGRINGDGEFDKLSTGEAHGIGNGIGKGSIGTLMVMESEGILRDMWNAALYLKHNYHETVGSVAWYTPSKGYVESDEPELIALEPFEKDDMFNGEKIPTTIQKWPFMNPNVSNNLRGLLIMRINISGKIVHLVEIQRRPKKTTDKNTEVIIKSEESFCGLVFILDNQDDFGSWLQFIRSNVRIVEGIVSKLTRFCPGKVGFFRHSTSVRERVPCFAALNNALNKVGIKIDQFKMSDL